MTVNMNDAERMKIAIDLIDSQSRDTQLLADYNAMITNILVLLLRSYPSLEAMKVAAESLFMFGYYAGKAAK